MPEIGVVADDLTGATTTGVLLARSGAKTAVYFNVEVAEKGEEVRELDAVLISTSSRPLPPNEAYEKVAGATRALAQMGVRYFTKRIDTTLRGGIGTEIDAMLDGLHQGTVAIVVPAMPQSHRIVVGGYSVIDGVALQETPVAQDVRTPVTESYVPKLLDGQSRRRVAKVGLEHVMRGLVETKKALKNVKGEGAEIIVVDAITLDHIKTIARALVELRWSVLSVDPGPMTAALAFERCLIQEERSNIPEHSAEDEGKTVLVVAGSATPVTERQMGILCEDARNRQISIDPRPLIEGGEQALAEVERVVSLATDLIEREHPRALLLETALHGVHLDLEDEDRKHKYAYGMSADRINAGLGTIAERIMSAEGREQIAGIYATGGDTMVNVCFHLESPCLELVDYVIAQTDIARLTGRYKGLPIVGKGGLTGNEHIACDIVDRLFKEATRV